MPGPERNARRRGRAGWTLSEILVSAACLVTLLIGALGALELVSAIRQRAPLQLTHEELVSTRPEGAWVRVVDGRVDYDLYLAVEDSAGMVERMFAPLRPPRWQHRGGADTRSPVTVLVSIEGSEAHRRVRTDALVRGLGGVWTGGVERRTVDGICHVVTRFGSADREALEPLQAALAKRIVVIDEGRRPNAFLGIALLFGAAVAGLLVFGVARAMSPHRDYAAFPWLVELVAPNAHARGRRTRSRRR